MPNDGPDDATADGGPAMSDTSAFNCNDVRELAPELALGTLSGAERAETLLHVNGCARCQALVADLTDVVDRLPLLVPEVEPPAGFGRATVAAMTGARRRVRFRRWAAIAATAAAAAIVSVTIVRVVDTDPSRPAAVAANPTMRTVPMVGAGGLPAGRVYLTGATETVDLALTVEYAVPDGRFGIEVRPPNGVAARVGEVDVADGRGWWMGTVSIPPGHDAVLALVDSSGRVLCHASLGTTIS